jgi:DNA polymerase I-like protein with 3'-5' exonuclease and polymerase domains
MNLPRNTTLYKLAGTETFRAASSAWFGYGTNLQNIEKSMRSLYYADDGKVLVQVDQSGAEALIVAYLCEKGRFRDLFLHSVKPHVFVAMNVFLEKWKILCKDIDVTSFATTPIPELKLRDGWKILDNIIKESDNWKASERYYYIAKMICHASNYGMRGAAFQMNVLEKSRGQIVLTKAQADDYLMRYHSLFPEIQRWHRAVIQEIKTTGMLRNLFGYPRLVTGRFDETDAKEWFAFAPQSTVGIITHKACTLLLRYIREHKRNWDILGNCHDSYVAQCPIGEEKEMAKVMIEFICPELTNIKGEKFFMKAEAQVGQNWSPYKKNTNEDGLKELQLG